MDKYLILCSTSDKAAYCMKRLAEVLGDEVAENDITKYMIVTKSGNIYLFRNFNKSYELENWDFQVIDELEFSSYLVKVLSDINRKNLLGNYMDLYKK